MIHSSKVSDTDRCVSIIKLIVSVSFKYGLTPTTSPETDIWIDSGEVKLEAIKSLRGGDISLYKGAESILALGVSLKESGGS